MVIFASFSEMNRSKKPLPLLEKVEIIDAGAEGKAIARHNNKVIFVPFVVPGDIVDIQVTRKKKSYLEGKAVRFHQKSDLRIEPRCIHFGVCGGCRWQNLDYASQLQFKQKQVKDAFERIGKLKFSEISPIIPSEKPYEYRNKLEFTFSNRKWFTEHLENSPEERDRYGLGFHLATMFDRIVDIEQCHLQEDFSNELRLAAREFALESGLEFYDVRKMKGFFRNLVIRCTSTGEWMAIVVFGEEWPEAISGFMDHLKGKFPKLTSLYYIINGKHNDDFSDLNPVLWYGKPHITEEMANPEAGSPQLKFRISPVSFFQTNSLQAARLYRTAWEFAGLKGNEIVYDLYSGAGTIASYLAGKAGKVIGIEYNVSAVHDARSNAELNGISNVYFFSGDILKVMDDHFIRETGQPDLIITDPPRAGMHEKVVMKILEIQPPKVIYISCNPSTQARDLSLMADKYEIVSVQPVDMFPQTHHVENVVLLVSRTS